MFQMILFFAKDIPSDINSSCVACSYFKIQFLRKKTNWLGAKEIEKSMFEFGIKIMNPWDLKKWKGKIWGTREEHRFRQGDGLGQGQIQAGLQERHRFPGCEIFSS